MKYTLFQIVWYEKGNAEGRMDTLACPSCGYTLDFWAKKNRDIWLSCPWELCEFKGRYATAADMEEDTEYDVRNY